MSALPECHFDGDPGSAFADVDFDPSLHFERWLAEVQWSIHNLSGRLPDPVIDTEHEIFLESQIRSNCDVTFAGVLHFDGYSVSNVTSPQGTLVLTKKGRIEADIEVATAIIAGAVTGNITASERVVLENDARVRGQIFTPALSMRLGALLDGDCLLITSAVDADAKQPVKKLMKDPVLFQLDDSLVSAPLSNALTDEGSEELEEFLLSA